MQVVVVGSGYSGTLVANRVIREVKDAQITLITRARISWSESGCTSRSPEHTRRQHLSPATPRCRRPFTRPTTSPGCARTASPNRTPSRIGTAASPSAAGTP
ncbi:hypothetical protein IU450_23435 [Nocardia abscessus]|nr:hypothetical protein [Nocardia abscessus]